MKKIKLVVSMVALLAATMFSSHEVRSQTAAPAVAAPAAAAGLKAVVKFTGTAPVMGKLKREADPYCAKTPMMDEEVTVNPNGTLKNVVVRVVSGAPAATTPPAEPVMVEQSNCMYRPRVVAGVVGQKLVIRNADPILHNVHSYVGPTTGFNQAQMKGSKDIEKTLTAGVMKFKCDVHPWMTGYAVGNDNAYICVTDATGSCTIANLPAGTYTLEAWQEKYGTKTASVTVAAGPTAVDFTYAGQ
jgi:plastocyanin